jgi:hypothetical protein
MRTLRLSFRFLPALLLLLAIGPSLRADDGGRQRLAAAIGAEQGENLLTVHGAVNALGGGWAGGSFEAARALELAESYRGSAEQVAALLKGRPAEVEGVAALLVKQAAALEAWIRIGDESLAEVYRKLRSETDAALLALVPGVPAASETPEAGRSAPRGETIELRIVEATAPRGQPGDLGTLKVTRLDEARPLIAEWAYESGARDRGLAVPLPESGRLAAFFGKGVRTVSIYRRDGGKVAGRWCSVAEGATIQEIRMSATKEPNRFAIEGGGFFSMEVFKGGIANATWHLESGDVPGFAVLDGDYLAAVTCDPSEKCGVALYSMAPDGKSAKGRWTMTGAGGVGEERLEIVAAPEGVVPEAEAEAEVRRLAAALREDFAAAREWRPTAEDLSALVEKPEDATALAAYVEAIYGEIPAGQSAAKPGQSEVIVFGPGLDELPGGYRAAISKFRPGTAIYGFKYVEPGQGSGMAYDGVCRVGERWVFIPKAWRAFQE